MSRIAYKDLEIVGFDGTILVECEPVLPVVRVKDSDRYFLLEAEHEDPSSVDDIDSDLFEFSTRSQIESLAERGLLTLLSKSFPAFPNAVIAYVNREFLSVADATIPDAVYSQQLTEEVSVMAGTNIAIEEILDTWATRILDQATLKLEQFLTDKNEQFRASAEHFGDLAICAASNRALRASIYMREGLAIMLSDRPERLDNFYRTSIHAEFQDWSWNGFHEQLRRLADVLKLRANYVISTSTKKAAAASSLIAQGESNELSELMKLSAATRAMRDDQERYKEATTNAKRYRHSNLIPVEWVDEVAKRISEETRVRLDKDVLRTLRGDALIYFLGDSVLALPRRNGESKMAPMMINEPYLKEALKFQSRGWDPGDVANAALELHKARAAAAA